ncbi:hypothetical protein B0H14DRAFT_2603135 [Mycena olivaceomarginata]|nr:hypothetical protein B0H14DRAFT_2603135 [Mycena olivaceomarginata]
MKGEISMRPRRRDSKRWKGGGEGACTNEEIRMEKKNRERWTYRLLGERARVAGRDNRRSSAGFNREERLQGDDGEGTWSAGKRGGVDVHQMCGDGIEARRDGGEAVQQARVGLQERDADLVWLGSTRRRVRTDGAEVETGLDERVAAEGRRAAPLCSRCAETGAVPTRELARVLVREMDLATGRIRKEREDKHTDIPLTHGEFEGTTHTQYSRAGDASLVPSVNI